jgi:hypothetical protein
MSADYIDLYALLAAAGCEIDHHESDLYVKATPEAIALVKASGWTYEWFRSDGASWLDVAFGYTPWWVAREEGKQD